ncbi:MAG: 50S ribosomal protein L21, partial [Patescibacteria group bacterium]
DAVTVGKPFVEGVAVEVKVLGTGRREKIRVQKAHRRKRYRRVHGHKQDFTEIEVVKIAMK